MHRRLLQPRDLTERWGIPVTGVVRTMLDLALELDPGPLERAINEADRLGLIDPEALREVLDGYRGQSGVARLRERLDRRTFRLTRSELERIFLTLTKQIDLPLPLTGQWVNGFEVDFTGLTSAPSSRPTDSRITAPPGQQARDRLRDQAHTAAGTTHLRFTHEQVRFERAHVRTTLAAVAQRLRRAS